VEVSRIDPERLVFVDEMGTHTSLAPLYAYAPVGERVFFSSSRSQETAARTRRFLRAFIEEGWDHRWPWKGRPQLGSSRPT
jgi:hypothetical protein